MADDGLAIRPAVAGDATAIAGLLHDLGYPTPAASVPARLQALGAEPATVVLVAEREGAVVGVITAHSLASIHDDRPVALITTLVVGDEARGIGVGRRLVDAVEQWARTRSCARVSVTTALHRSGAHAFYDHLGYSHSGRRYGKSLV